MIGNIQLQELIFGLGISGIRLDKRRCNKLLIRKVLRLNKFNNVSLNKYGFSRLLNRHIREVSWRGCRGGGRDSLKSLWINKNEESACPPLKTNI